MNMPLLAENRYITLKYVKLKYNIFFFLQKIFIICLKTLKQRNIKNKGKKKKWKSKNTLRIIISKLLEMCSIAYAENLKTDFMILVGV